MRRKVIQHFADVFCQMFVGWRMAEDIEILSNIRQGHIDIDVLHSHSSVGDGQLLNLHIAGELQAWFIRMLNKHKIPVEAIREAKLLIDIKVDVIEKKRRKLTVFDFTCQSAISTDEKTYQSSLTERHTWHQQKNQMSALSD